MVEATMRQESSGPHLFGLATIEDPDTLRQMLGGWFNGIDVCMPVKSLAFADRYGQGFVLFPTDKPEYIDGFAYPLHVIVPVTLPASAVKPAPEARPYRR